MRVFLLSLALTAPDAAADEPTGTELTTTVETDTSTPMVEPVSATVEPSTTTTMTTAVVEPAVPAVAATPAAVEPAPEPPPVADEKPADLTNPTEAYDGGMKWTFGKQDQHSLRLISWLQVWNRYNQTNPGTLVNGKERDHQWDVALRRARLLFLVSFGKRFQLMTHFGINNQSFNNARKPQLYIHDGWTQFLLFKTEGKLAADMSIGTGLHYWNGISRLTNASTLNLMALDAPILNWPTIEQSDQFARQMGIWVKGKVGPVDYRVALNQPFAVNRTYDADGNEVYPTGGANYNPGAATWNLVGYVMWQFLDKESNAVPYLVGSYLGEKRVFNLGFGWHYQDDGMWIQEEDGTVDEHDIVLLGADAFLDMPFKEKEKRGALTAYAVYYYYDFGPNHLRNVGILNTGTAGADAPGPAGNAYPTIGTGHHIYAQVGYVLPWTKTGIHRLQPYVTTQLSFFEALDAPAVIPEVGINWYLLGHHARLTAMYKNRPVFANTPDENGERVVDTRRSEAILQAMLYF